MRILIASNTCPPRFVGGAELMAHEQAKALALLGHEVRIFAGDLGSTATHHERTDDVYEGIRFHRIATDPEDYSPEFLNFLHPRVDAHFHDVLRDFAPDIVHCHNLIGLSVKLPLIARQQGAGIVCTLHDFWAFCLRNTAIRSDGTPCGDITQCRTCLPRLHDGRDLFVPLRFRKDFMRLALDYVDRFVAPSRYMAERHVNAGFSADRITVIPNGVDVARFYPAFRQVDPDTIRITYAGYFGTHKGVTTLLQAVARMPHRRVTLELAGEGPEERTYRAQAEALGIGERVHFLGKVRPADMPGIYGRSDIVVLPSVWDENQPVCLMEAMAAGVSVVASRKGGIPELIEHGQNGLMFAAGDATDLTAQLEKLVDDPALRVASGRAGRRRVEALSHTRQAARLLETYSDVLAGRHQPEPRRDVFAAMRSLDMEEADEDTVLAVGIHPDRHFIPHDWITDRTLAFAGMLPTAKAWRMLHRLKINVIPFPLGFRNMGNILMRWLVGRL